MISKIFLISFTLLASCVSPELIKDENARIFVYNIKTDKFELPKGRNLDNPNLIEYDITQTGWSKYSDGDSLEILNSHQKVKR